MKFSMSISNVSDRKFLIFAQKSSTFYNGSVIHFNQTNLSVLIIYRDIFLHMWQITFTFAHTGRSKTTMINLSFGHRGTKHFQRLYYYYANAIKIVAFYIPSPHVPHEFILEQLQYRQNKSNLNYRCCYIELIHCKL